jgi:hypothetical protein
MNGAPICRIFPDPLYEIGYPFISFINGTPIY